MIRKVKTSPKMFKSNPEELKAMVLKTMSKISEIVGSTFGPGGKNVLIEADYPGIPNKNTKDGVTVFNSLGSSNSYEHLIIEQARDAAKRTATEAGDGPQPLWAKVLTPKGFVAMGDLKVGMEVCGTDGTIQKVVGVYPKGKKEIIQVTFSGGRVVECCADHLWSVTTNAGTEKVMTTRQMMSDFKSLSSNGNVRYKYYTPKTAVDFISEERVTVDPYLIGVLIGDGTLMDSGSIEISIGDKKEHILKKLNLPNGLSLNIQHVDSKNYFRVKIQGKTEDGKTIRDLVEEVGLRNAGSSDKFIPQKYLLSSTENRERLLAGLLDTDGHINVRGRFEFSTISKRLMDDFVFLVRSLGKDVYLSKIERKETDGSYSDREIYRAIELKGYKNGDKIIDIKETGKLTEMQCIKVSNPNSLYITDNFIVTHNTTTATILSAALVQYLFDFCERNSKYSPQKAARQMAKIAREELVPIIQSKAIKIDEDNKELLKMVAKVSANGDEDMANAVIEAFEMIGYGDSSHVTIKELSGPYGYNVELIEGFPIPIGFEESIGKFHTAFINDQGNQRLYLEKPLFLLFDGQIVDLVTIKDVLERLGQEYVEGRSEYKNLVIFAHGYSDNVLNQLTWNFANPNTINVVPMVTPMAQFANSQLQFLMDLSAFTGAKVFGMKDAVAHAQPEDLGSNMEAFEAYRFRSTVVGNPEPTNIELRAEDLKAMKANAASTIEKQWLEERLGKLTSGIAKLTIFGGSNGELKEAHDRCEDAVCAVRSAIAKGALPGGCRVFIDLAMHLEGKENKTEVEEQILIPALLTPITRLLENAGYSEEESSAVIEKLIGDQGTVYDIENGKFGQAEKLGVFDAAPAVEEALKNAISIATVMGTIGGIVAYPRDDQFERAEASADRDFDRAVNSPELYENEANKRA